MLNRGLLGRAALIALTLALVVAGCHKKGKIESGGGQTPPAPAPGITPSPTPSPSTGTASMLALYDDAGGVLGDPNVLLFTGGGLQINELSGGAPEGEKYLHATNAVLGAFWGITFDKSNTGQARDLSHFSSGGLRFWIRVSRNIGSTEKLDIDVSDNSEHRRSVRLTTAVNFDPTKPNTWQDISIPISAYDGISLSAVEVPFAIAVRSPSGTPDVSIDIDDIRWELPYQDLGGPDSGIVLDAAAGG